MHMGNPSLTLVIRNSGGLTQFDYSMNGLGTNFFQNRRTIARQAEVLRAYRKANPDGFETRLLEFLKTGSAHRVARILKELEDGIDNGFLRGAVGELAVERFGALGELIMEARTQSIRSGKIWTCFRMRRTCLRWSDERFPTRPPQTCCWIGTEW